jgi:hypothetical protein
MPSPAEPRCRAVVYCRRLSGAPSRKKVATVGVHVKYFFFHPQTGDRVELKKFGKWHGSSVTAAYRNARGVK